ncbi:MAG: trehalose-6-phosphate synthase [Calditrichaeota bacterium]|nr:MAG: trehalose-6-phosphate synthase [Calditrichota bacterium]
MNDSEKRLVVVSNRLPVSISGDEKIGYTVEPGAGGLITALKPIIKRTKGAWLGWPGCNIDVPFDKLLQEYSNKASFSLLPVGLTEEDIAMYYRGFSNRSIWPLFHDLIGQFSFVLEEYERYKVVNRKFAETIAKNITENDNVWIHDYQLIFVGSELRDLQIKTKLNFFLHIPFPSVDLLRRLPRNQTIIKRFLAYDHIGFQTAVDKRNFVSCVKWLIPEARIINKRTKSYITYNDQKTVIGYYPISIDFNEFNDVSKSKEASDTAWYLKENINAKFLVLGLDRLDYTKGIPQRFLAFEKLLEKHEDVRGEISLLQVVIPSRLNVPDYQNLRDELEQLLGRINGRFSTSGWVPIHYQFNTLDRVRLVGHYKAADIALVTPLRDGMNLVSKEYCASSIDNKGVLMLSEFAGAADQLGKGAILCNPFDIDRTAEQIYEAFRMSDEEKERRMRLMRSEVKKNNVDRWVRQFFEVNH